MERKYERLMRAMELEQGVDTSDRPSLELTCQDTSGNLSEPVVPPFQKIVDPETGHVIYRKKTAEDNQQDYS